MMESRKLTLRLTNGKWATIQRMSVFNRLDFSYHLQQAYEVLAESANTPLVDLYVENDEFQYHCDQCLKLSHLDPNLLSDTQMIGLLFGSTDYPYGLLNQFNYDLEKVTSNAKAPSKPDTRGSILGKLWRSLGDLQIAIKVASELPVDVLEDALYQMKPEEERNKDKARETLKSLGIKDGVPTKPQAR